MSGWKYPAYRASREVWVGSVPDHWGMVPLKYLVRLRGGVTPSKENFAYWDGNVPWASSKDLKSESLSDTEDHITEEAVQAGAAVLVPAGSVLIVVRGMILAHSFPVTSVLTEMAINQDLKALTPRDALTVEFLPWLLRALTGITLGTADEAAHGTKVLRIPAWTSTRVPVPPHSEQLEISSFLLRETAAIDSLISEQQRIINLLNEKRQAVISHAVTKGLNPDAAMKNSGIEWLGEVPALWSVLSLGRVTRSCCDGPFGSGLKSEHYTDNGVRVVRLQNIRAAGFDSSNAAFVNATYYAEALSGHDVDAGDVLVAGLGDDNNVVGRACVAPSGIAPAMVKADCFRFRVDTSVALPEFVATALSATAPATAGMLSTGSTRSRIPLSVMRTRKIPLPPIQEQREIDSFVQEARARFDGLIREAQRAMDLLAERRTALIAAAVTGQIDVRGLASVEVA